MDVEGPGEFETNPTCVDQQSLRQELAVVRRLVLEQEEFLATEALAPDGYEGGTTSEWLARARRLEKQFEEALGRAYKVAKKAQVELSEKSLREPTFCKPGRYQQQLP